MLRKNSNITMSLLTDATVTSGSLPGSGVVVTPANLPKGAVVVTDLGLKVVTTTIANMVEGQQFLIVQGRGVTKSLLKSPILTKGRLSITAKKHIAAVQQKTAIGFNGTTGSLPFADSTSYFVKIRKNDNDSANQSQPSSLFAQYKTSANATQEELALGLAVNANKNFADEPANGYVKFSVLCDEAGTEALGADDTIVAVKGSKVVTITETGGVLPYLFVVGDFIRFGTTPSDPVYKITATTVTVADGGTLTLDRPATDDFAPAAGVGTTEYITAAQAAAAEFGIVIEGVEAPFDVNKFRNYYVNRFTATFSDEDVPVTHLVGAFSGNGVWQQVAMDEYMTYGFEGQNEMLAVPPTLRDQFVKIPGIGSDTADTSRYAIINIAWNEGVNTLVSSHAGQGSVMIACNLDSSGAVAGTVSANVGTQFGVNLLTA